MRGPDLGRAPAQIADWNAKREDDGMDDLVAFLNARLDEDEWTAKAEKDAAAKRTHYRASLMAGADRHLREVAFKRAILARHAPYRTGGWVGCSQCDDERAQEWPCPDVCELAAVYSGHPGYRAEWKPSGR